MVSVRLIIHERQVKKAASSRLGQRIRKVTAAARGIRYSCREPDMAAKTKTARTTNAATTNDRQLSELESTRYRFGRGEAARVARLLKKLGAARFTDTASLLRFHETLLFLRAFPHGPVVVRATEQIL